jgi:hypothetical protein
MKLRKPGIVDIYELLYYGRCSKQMIAQKLSISHKTLETRLKAESNIVYDRKISAYTFTNLLPNIVTVNFFHYLLRYCSADKATVEDFNKVYEQTDSKEYVQTDTLSFAMQNVIALQIAATYGCEVKIEYTDNKLRKEQKYIIPKQLVYSRGETYLYANYSPKNKKDIGQARTFFVGSIASISPQSYIRDFTKHDQTYGNAFGVHDKPYSVVLKLNGAAKNFFTRNIATDIHYDLIEISPDNTQMVARFYYKNELEIVSMIQKWMPLITIQSKDGVESIKKTVVANFESWRNLT